MAQLSRFFNNEEYHAHDWAEFFMNFLSNGFFNGLRVTSDGDMVVNIDTGAAFIEGYEYRNTSILSLELNSAHSSNDRIDRVILRLDLNNPDILAYIIEGESESNPEPPELTRTDDVYELSLAQVFVEGGRSYVDNGDITDERGDWEVCGRVGLAREVDDQITSVDVMEVSAYPSEYGEGVMSFRMSGNETPEIFQDWLDDIGISAGDYGRDLDQLRAHVHTQSNRNDTGVQTITIYDWRRSQDYQILGKFSRAANALDNPLWGSWHEEVLLHDRGSDDNGSWIRYTNGTMECWYLDDEETQVETSATGGTYWSYKSFNFPKQFIEEPIVTHLCRRANNVQWSGLRSSGENDCEIYIFSTVETGSGYLGYSATGRWR